MHNGSKKSLSDQEEGRYKRRTTAAAPAALPRGRPAECPSVHVQLKSSDSD